MKSLVKCAKCGKNPKALPRQARPQWQGNSEDRGSDPSGLGLRPDVDKPVRVERPPSSSSDKKQSVFDKLTDTKQYTGTHKQRFDAEGKGRGREGRDSAPTGTGTVVGPVTTLRTPSKPGEVEAENSQTSTEIVGQTIDLKTPASSTTAPTSSSSNSTSPSSTAKTAKKSVTSPRMVCPHCAFRWVRPPDSKSKACPKCFKKFME